MKIQIQLVLSVIRQCCKINYHKVQYELSKLALALPHAAAARRRRKVFTRAAAADKKWIGAPPPPVTITRHAAAERMTSAQSISSKHRSLFIPIVILSHSCTVLLHRLGLIRIWLNPG